MNSSCEIFSLSLFITALTQRRNQALGRPWGPVSSPCFILCCLAAKSCRTMLRPHGRPGSSVHGISQATILEGVIVSFSRGSSQRRARTRVSFLAGGFFRSPNRVRVGLLSGTSAWDDARPSRTVKTKPPDRGDGEFRQEEELLGLGLDSSPRSREALYHSGPLFICQRKGLAHRTSKLSLPWTQVRV